MHCLDLPRDRDRALWRTRFGVVRELSVAPAEEATSAPVRLAWKPTTGARQYRVTVFDAEGSIMWEGATADTATVVPPSVTLSIGVAYWWRVEARVGFDRWTQSELTPFSIRGSASSHHPQPDAR